MNAKRALGREAILDAMRAGSVLIRDDYGYLLLDQFMSSDPADGRSVKALVRRGLLRYSGARRWGGAVIEIAEAAP